VEEAELLLSVSGVVRGIEVEDDLLDKAWGLDPDSRLSCQAIVGDADLVIEIPKYTINQVTENR